MTDEEKHALSIKRTGHPATILPRSLYEAAEREGIDMTPYVINKPIPVPAIDDWNDGHGG